MHLSASVLSSVLYTLISLTSLTTSTAVGSPVLSPESRPDTNLLSKRALGLNAPCESNPNGCAAGLSCIGLDNRRKCVCNIPKCFGFGVNRLFGLPACRSRQNPGGTGFTRVTRCGCGDALTADPCGNGRADVVFVTSTTREIRCGQPC